MIRKKKIRVLCAPFRIEITLPLVLTRPPIILASQTNDTNKTWLMMPFPSLSHHTSIYFTYNTKFQTIYLKCEMATSFCYSVLLIGLDLSKGPIHEQKCWRYERTRVDMRRKKRVFSFSVQTHTPKMLTKLWQLLHWSISSIEKRRDKHSMVKMRRWDENWFVWSQTDTQIKFNEKSIWIKISIVLLPFSLIIFHTIYVWNEKQKLLLIVFEMIVYIIKSFALIKFWSKKRAPFPRN